MAVGVPFTWGRPAALLVGAAAALGVLWAGAASGEVTDEQVCGAIEKAREYLINQQQADGTWPEKKYYSADAAVGTSEWVLLTLVYIGEHPNREVVSKGLDAIIGRRTEYTYAVAARIMALARIQKQLTEPKRGLLRAAIARDVQFLAITQRDDGGWGYTASGKMSSSNYRDLSCTQMAVLALWEAERAGIEVPPVVWKRVADLYVGLQRADGSWNYGETDQRAGGENLPGYGSMTAAGLASLFIATDRLDVSVGCPCRGGRSPGSGAEFNRRIDAALDWLDKHFQVDQNPEGGRRSAGASTTGSTARSASAPPPAISISANTTGSRRPPRSS